MAARSWYLDDNGILKKELETIRCKRLENEIIPVFIDKSFSKRLFDEESELCKRLRGANWFLGKNGEPSVDTINGIKMLKKIIIWDCSPVDQVFMIHRHRRWDYRFENLRLVRNSIYNAPYLDVYSIPNVAGEEIIIDEEDSNLVKPYEWEKGYNGLVFTRNKQGELSRLDRMILKTELGITYLNEIKTDLRKSNLKTSLESTFNIKNSEDINNPQSRESVEIDGIIIDKEDEHLLEYGYYWGKKDLVVFLENKTQRKLKNMIVKCRPDEFVVYANGNRNDFRKNNLAIVNKKDYIKKLYSKS